MAFTEIQADARIDNKTDRLKKRCALLYIIKRFRYAASQQAQRSHLLLEIQQGVEIIKVTE